MDAKAKLKKAIAQEEAQVQSQHFADRVFEAVRLKGSPICVGLDPKLELIPAIIKGKALKENKDKFKAAAEAILAFNKAIIDEIHDLVPVVKPQVACFEQYGYEGMRAYAETLKYAKSKGLLTIADVKRGDIGSTAEAYSHAYLGKVNVFDEQQFVFDADAVTLNPYLGIDSIKPFMDDARKYNKGIFMLVKTSNKSSSNLQDLEMTDGNAVYQITAHYLDSWGSDDLGDCGYSLLGAVVGATFPAQAEKLRKIMPEAIFLVPGYGAQGGTAKDVKACFDENGRGALVNSSRSIIYAYKEMPHIHEKDFALAAREAVLKMKKDLESEITFS